MRVIAVIVFLLSTACPAASVLSSKSLEEPITNFEWLAALLDSVTRDLYQRNLLSGNDPVLIEVVASDSLFAGVQMALLSESLSKGNANVVRTAAAGRYRSLILRWVDWSLNYVAVNGAAGTYQRNLKALFFVELLDHPGGRVVLAERYEQQLNDTLSQKEMLEVGTMSLPFTLAGNQADKVQGHPLWEKSFLFAISATVVYLFYSIRSQ